MSLAAAAAQREVDSALARAAGQHQRRLRSGLAIGQQVRGVGFGGMGATPVGGPVVDLRGGYRPTAADVSPPPPGGPGESGGQTFLPFPFADLN